MEKKNVLITGASRGIGKAMALKFAESGYNVGINYYSNDAAANECLKEVFTFNVDADIFKYDVSDPKSATELIDAFISRFGHIDVLINNAASSLISPITQTTNEEWERIISTNLSAAFYLSKATLPFFLKNEKGNIINISSMWGATGASCEVAYSASKSGLIGFTKALAKELGPSNIRVNCISPGFIDTDMNSPLSNEDFDFFKNSTPLLRVGEPKDVAPIAVFLASDNAGFITGAVIPVDGGFPY